jgi:ribose 5-phosphate isomerase RpiB
MSSNGQLPDASADGQVLRWSGRVVALDELRRSLNGHRELVLPPQAVITPLAVEELRTNGVRITYQPAEKKPQTKATWGYAQERPLPLVSSAVQSLEREGFSLRALPAESTTELCRWAKVVAECVGRGECRGGVIFCADPGLVCCVANKVKGLRAVGVTTVLQAARATLALGANLIAVEVPGRTFFEVRQILRALCQAGAPACPAGLSQTLAELDGHAHR